MVEEATMEERLVAANEAARRSQDLLDSWLETRGRARNVEHEPAFRKIDVDFVWTTKDGAVHLVEAKGDTRAHQTGNYAIETKSNKERGTPGCFLYSQAEYWHYHLLETGEVDVFPLDAVRDWFLPRRGQFYEAETRTKVGGVARYTTVCALVSRDLVKRTFGALIQTYKVPVPSEWLHRKRGQE